MAVKEIPDRYLGMIIHFLMNFHNDTSEFSRPHLRKSFQNSYKFFIFLYGLIIVFGFVANILLIIKIRSSHLSMYKYLAMNALNEIIKCVFVLPLALSTILLQNWVYGSGLCYLFPMIQDIPFHATMLTFVLIAFDRYRQTLYPLKQLCPPIVCMASVYSAAVLAVLPYAVYTRYLDLEAYFGAQFKGTGICAINVDDNIEEYIRALFIIMYVLPLGLTAFLHIKASEEIKVHQTALTVTFHEPSITFSVPQNNDDKDWVLEKQMQSFLARAVTTYATCLLPLNLVRLLKHVVYETHENSFHFDITFIMVVWLAFLPTITTPAMFIFWQQGVPDASRYLRLGRSKEVTLQKSLIC